MMSSWRKNDCFGFYCVLLDFCSKVKLEDAGGGFLSFFLSFFLSLSLSQCLETEVFNNRP